jgi:hypothetical protein
VVPLNARPARAARGLELGRRPVAGVTGTLLARGLGARAETLLARRQVEVLHTVARGMRS